MSHADLTLAAWLDLSDEAAERTAAAIARGAGARLTGALVTADEDDDEFGHAWMLAGRRDRGWRPPSPTSGSGRAAPA